MMRKIPLIQPQRSYPKGSEHWQGLINVHSKDAINRILKARILKLTNEPTRVKNHISATGKTVAGDLRDPMNLQGITENIRGLSHLNVQRAIVAFRDQITCRFTWNDITKVCYEGQKRNLSCMKFQLGPLCEAVGKWYPSSNIYNFILYEKVPKQEKTVKKMGSIES